MARITNKELDSTLALLNSKLGLKEGDDKFIRFEIQRLEHRYYKLANYNGSVNVSTNMVAKECELFMRGMLASLSLKGE